MGGYARRVILHDNPLSSNAQKVRFLLAELGLDYERRVVPFGPDRPDWHRSVNPTGGIPALVDGDLTLAESNAILRYLANREGRDDLYPSDARARAAVDWFLDHQATFFRPASLEVEQVAFGLRPGRGLFAEEPGTRSEVQAVLDIVRPRLERTMQLLGPSPWACLGRFTIADVAAGPFLYRLSRTEVPLGESRLEEWAEAVVTRPAWADVVAPEAGI